jgi:hypothetical protein
MLRSEDDVFTALKRTRESASHRPNGVVPMPLRYRVFGCVDLTDGAILRFQTEGDVA